MEQSSAPNLGSLVDPKLFYSYAMLDLQGYKKVSRVFRPTQQGNFDTDVNNTFEILVTNAPHYLLDCELQAEIESFSKIVAHNTPADANGSINHNIAYNDNTVADSYKDRGRIFPHASYLIESVRKLHGRGGKVITEIQSYFYKYMDMMLPFKHDAEEYGYYRVPAYSQPVADVLTLPAQADALVNKIAPGQTLNRDHGIVAEILRCEEMERYLKLE